MAFHSAIWKERDFCTDPQRSLETHASWSDPPYHLLPFASSFELIKDLTVSNLHGHVES